MATLRISRVTAKSNSPSSVRVARVAVQQGAAPLDSSIRIAGVRVDNAPRGDVWVMSGGVWFSAAVFVRSKGEWTTGGYGTTYGPTYEGTY